MGLIFDKPDRDKNYLSYLVFILSWTWIAVCTFLISLGFVLIPEARERWMLLLSAVIITCAGSLMLNKIGHTKIASYILPVLLYLVITVSALTAGGIEAPIVFAFLPVILTTGFLLGGKKGLAMAMLCIFTTCLFVYAAGKGMLPHTSVVYSPFNRWVVYLIPFLITIVIQYYATDHIRTSLERLSKQMEEKEKVEAVKERAISEINERVKELKTLYSSSRIFQDEERPVDATLQQFVNNIPAGWQYPEITAARVWVGEKQYATPNFVETRWCQKAEIFGNKNTRFVIEVVYLEGRPVMDEGVFLNEERSLINMLAEMLKSYLDQIKAHKALQKSEANLQTILKTTEVAYVLVDTKMNIVSLNHSSLEFWKREFGTTIKPGGCITDYLPVDKKPELNKMMAQALTGHYINYESHYPQSDGSFNYYHFNMSPISTSNNSNHGFLMAVTDITGLKKAEHEIRELNESLERKVEERTRELLEANRELEAFSYTVSHDLQAPLKVINGYGNLLLRTQATQLNEEGMNFLQVINEKADQMSTLIKDLLKFSKFGKAPLNKEEVNMNETVQAVVDEVRLANYSKGADIRTGNLPSAVCDAALIRQVWGNLVSNAVKYSSKKAQAVVEIGYEQRGDAMVYFVKDNGAGFDMQHADKLFKVFKRLHSQNDFEGTGVGLATVERIINKHGGKIWVYAEPNAGATFYFTLS